MNEAILQEAGLTDAEAHVYALLVKNSPSTPPALAEMSGESRTNTYKLLDTLEEMGLVARDESQKKLRYWANNPSHLLDQLKKQRSDVEAAERRFQQSLPLLVEEYFKYSEQPAIRYFHGVDGVKKIYKDQLKTGQPITQIFSPALIDIMGKQNAHLLRNEFPKHDISQHVFFGDAAPYVKSDEPSMTVAESDKIMKMTRTWLDENDLKQPVEWTVYGDKLSIVSLGNELIGMIIESPQIAASFREILALLDRKVRNEPGYEQLPRKRTHTMIPESIKEKAS
jgi:predicted transcriptional regulator|tara:strand:- start:7005 stop:7850 length:846 start_codon:yes stop_codon:yes gene_type:complete